MTHCVSKSSWLSELFFLHGQLGVSHMCNAGNESLRPTWDSISLSPSKKNLFVRIQESFRSEFKECSLP